jgi:hypothetical protein
MWVGGAETAVGLDMGVGAGANDQCGEADAGGNGTVEAGVLGAVGAVHVSPVRFTGAGRGAGKCCEAGDAGAAELGFGTGGTGCLGTIGAVGCADVCAAELE